MSNKDCKYLFIAKVDGKWILRARGNSKKELEKAQNNFMQSAYLLDITETKIIHPKDVENYSELGWQNDISIKEVKQ